MIDNILENQMLADAEQEKTSFTSEELANFLAEISAEDEDLSNTELSVVSEIENTKLEDEDDNTLVEELIKDNRELIKEKHHDAVIKSFENKRAKQLEITRLAFNQQIVQLSAKLTNFHIRKLIELLTEPIKQLIDKYDRFINTRIEKLITPVIPNALKLSFIRYPQAFIKHPGFLYKTHEDMGPIKTFYAIPNIPYYFEQGREQQVLEERDAYLTYYYLRSLDRAVHRWHNAKRTLAEREVKYGLRLLKLNKRTFYGLLVMNPIWFEKLYLYLKDEIDRASKPLL